MNKVLPIFILIIITACSESNEPPKLKSYDLEKPSNTLDYSVTTVTGGQSNHGSIKGITLNNLNQRIIENQQAGAALAVDRVLYYIDLKGELISLNLKNWKEYWRVPVDQTSYFSPVIKDNRLYLLSLKGKIYSIDTIKGTIIFSFNLDSSPVSNLIIHDEQLLVTLESGALTQVSPGENKVINSSVPTGGNQILLDGKLYISERDNLIRVYNIDGSLNKTIETGIIGIEELSGGIGLLAISGETYGIFDLEKGEMIYRDDSFYWTTIDSNEILLSRKGGGIRMISRTGFTKIWDKSLGIDIDFKPLIVGESIVLLGKRYLSVLDRFSGEELNSFYNVSPPLYGPVVTSDLVSIISGKGLSLYSSTEFSNRNKDIYIELFDGGAYSLPMVTQGITLEFTPRESRVYNLFSETMSVNPVEMEVVKSDGTIVGKNIGYSSYEEGFLNNLEKGETYYIHCRSLSNEFGDFSLEVK